MKKLLHLRLWVLLIAVCASLGTKAEYITQISQITSGEYYRIVNTERGKALTALSGSTEVNQASIDLGDRYQRWQITLDAETGLYTLYNEGREMSLAKPSSISNGTDVLMGETAGKYIIRKTTVTTSQATYFNILPEGSTNPALNNYQGSWGTGVVKLWDANTGGEWKIEPFPASDLQDADMFKRGIFRLRSRRTNTKYATEDTNTHGLVGKTKISTTGGNYSQIWLLAPRSNGAGYLIYNMATGRKLIHADKNTQYKTTTETGGDFYFLKSSSSTTSKTYWNIAEAASYSSTSDERSLNYNDGYGTVLSWTFTGDQGSDWEIEPIDDSEITIDQARSAVQNAQNQPQIEDGKYYYISNYNNGKILQEEFYSATYGKMIGGNQVDENYAQIWQALKQGDGKYALQNVASKRYVQAATSAQVNSRTTLNSFTTEENEQYRYERLYNFKSTETGGLSLNGDNQVVLSDVSNNGPNHTNAEWILKEVALTPEQIADAEAQFAAFTDIKKRASSYVLNITKYFEDAACTQLKPDFQAMTDQELRDTVGTRLNEDLIKMMIKIKNNAWATYTSGKNWEQLYRIRDYKAYSHKDAMGSALGVVPWSRINNPTGITSGKANYPIYIFVDKFTMPTGGNLYAEFLSNVDLGGPKQYTLKKGLNIIYSDIPNASLFIFYESKNGDLLSKYDPIKIHVEGGDVNGFFDTNTQTDEDWADMWNDGLFNKAFAADVVGKYVIWHMNKEKLHPAVGNKPIRVMNIWDKIVELEINLMGIQESEHYKNENENLYPSVYNNLMGAISATKGYMWSQNGGTFYEEGTISSIMNYNNMNGTGALWGPAHEIGHNNQSVIKLVGTTEVSNNLFSNMVVYSFDKITTRYWNIQLRQDKMNLSWPDFYNSGGEPIAPMNRMYFTLYLYYHVLGNKPDFYQRVFESLRHSGFNHSTPTYAKNDYLKFAKVVCDVAQEDLTEYFDYWGFFKPCDTEIGDYANYHIINDAAQIEECKNYIKSKNYPKNGNILFLDDRAEQLYQADGSPKGYMEEYSVAKTQNNMGTFTAFRNNYKVEGYTATVAASTGKVTIKEGRGAVGYKVYDSTGQLQYVATQKSFTLPSWIEDKENIVIIAAGAKPENDLVIYGDPSIVGIESVSIDPEKKVDVYYDLFGRPVTNPSKGIYISKGQKHLFP